MNYIKMEENNEWINEGSNEIRIKQENKIEKKMNSKFVE